MTDKRFTELKEQLAEVRADFGWRQDDYRQAKIDVAIQMVEECEDMAEEWEEADLWPPERGEA